jgi:hypothetical protein
VPPPADALRIQLEDAAVGPKRFTNIEVGNLLAELFRCRFVAGCVDVKSVDRCVAVTNDSNPGIPWRAVEHPKLVGCCHSIMDDNALGLGEVAGAQPPQTRQKRARSPGAGCGRLELCDQLGVTSIFHEPRISDPAPLVERDCSPSIVGHASSVVNVTIACIDTAVRQPVR